MEAAVVVEGMKDDRMITCGAATVATTAQTIPLQHGNSMNTVNKCAGRIHALVHGRYSVPLTFPTRWVGVQRAPWEATAHHLRRVRAACTGTAAATNIKSVDITAKLTITSVTACHTNRE